MLPLPRPGDSPFMAMHKRLVLWGLIFLKGGRYPAEYLALFESNSVDIKREWPGYLIEAAGALHSRVIRLPGRQRIVAQVFYRENVAEIWYDSDIIPRWAQIEKELTPEVNHRLRDLARQLGRRAEPIRAYEFRAVREDAIRSLIATEGLPQPRHHPHAYR